MSKSLYSFRKYNIYSPFYNGFIIYIWRYIFISLTPILNKIGIAIICVVFLFLRIPNLITKELKSDSGRVGVEFERDAGSFCFVKSTSKNSQLYWTHNARNKKLPGIIHHLVFTIENWNRPPGFISHLTLSINISPFSY